MPLMIRNPKAVELARKLATRRGRTMTDVVIVALENEIKRDADELPLWERIKAISDDLLSKSEGPGRKITKDEIDRMWGHD